MKIGELEVEWVLLHCRNGEQFVGLVEVPEKFKGKDITPETYPEIADQIMQSKDADGYDNLITVRNPHQISMAPNGANVILPLSMGSKVVFMRAGEVLFPQFLDQASPIVKQIRQAQTGIVTPGAPGESKTEGGLIIPGGGLPK